MSKRLEIGKTVTLRHLLLGLLAQQSMSGYDILGSLRSLSWLIGSPSSGSLYPVLRSLLEEKLLTVEVVPGRDRPPRKIYSTTQAGLHELQTWIEQPIASDATMKAFVLRLLLAGNFSFASLTADLKQRRAQVEDHRAEMERTTRGHGPQGDLGQRLASEYGLVLAQAELMWLDRMLDRFAQLSLGTDGAQSQE